MRTTPAALTLTLLLGACGEEPGPSRKKSPPPGEDFTFDHTVRITAPTNGETVDAAFTVAVETGADVSSVRVRLDDARVGTISLSEIGDGSIAVTAEAGRHNLTAEAIDPDGVPVSEHTVVFRVAEDDTPWVTLTSPSDGDTVRNPVRFTVEADPDG